MGSREREQKPTSILFHREREKKTRSILRRQVYSEKKAILSPAGRQNVGCTMFWIVGTKLTTDITIHVEKVKSSICTRISRYSLGIIKYLIFVLLYQGNKFH